MPHLMEATEEGIILRGSRSKSFVVWMKPLGKWLLAATLALFQVLGVDKNCEANGPAVSRINAKAVALVGSLDDDSAAIGIGALSLPVGKWFGFQLDAGIGAVSGDDYWGSGAHFFWRDPSAGLIGLIGLYQNVDDEILIRNGAEGEWYLGDFTIGGRAGYQYGDAKHGGFFSAGLKYYAMNNLALEFEPQIEAGDLLVKAALEYDPELIRFPGLSIFAQGELGEDSHDSLFGGIRYYFGSKKSLKLRHREDAPSELLPHVMK